MNIILIGYLFLQTLFSEKVVIRMENNGIEITPHLRDSTSKHPHTIIFISDVTVWFPYKYSALHQLGTYKVSTCRRDKSAS